MSRLERQDCPSRSYQVWTSSSYYPTVICRILTSSRCSPPTQKLSFNVQRSSPTSELTSPHRCLGHDPRPYTSACAPVSLLPPLFQFPLRAHPLRTYSLSPILHPHICRTPVHLLQHNSLRQKHLCVLPSDSASNIEPHLDVGVDCRRRWTGPQYIVVGILQRDIPETVLEPIHMPPRLQASTSTSMSMSTPISHTREYAFKSEMRFPSHI